MLKNKYNKLPLYFLLLIFILPIFASSTLYFFRDKINFKTIEKGHLLAKPLAPQTLPFFQKNFLGKWQIIHLKEAPVNPSRKDTPDTLAKIHLALGKDRHRVGYQNITFSNIAFQSSTTNPLVFKKNNVVILDPKGWLIMYYDSLENPQDILKDLRRLLKYSHGNHQK